MNPLNRALQIFQKYLDEEGEVYCLIDLDGLLVDVDPKYVTDKEHEELKTLGFHQEHNGYRFEQGR